MGAILSRRRKRRDPPRRVDLPERAVLPFLPARAAPAEGFMAEAFLTRRSGFSAARHFHIPSMTGDEAERTYGHTGAHGHDYLIDLTIRGAIDPVTGMVENLDTMKEVLRREVADHLDAVFLNRDIPFFGKNAPTLENLALYVHRRLESRYGEALHAVALAEEEDYRVELRAGREEMYVTRTYRFCAGHRLHRPELSDEENRACFGKCNNPNGHGHNYRLEITVAGGVDERTGKVCRAGDLDDVARREVIDYLDHRNLNEDIEEFRDLNPTAENIARVAWERLGERPGGAALYRVRVYETDRNVADYYGR